MNTMKTEQVNYDCLVDDIDACAPGYWANHILTIGQADVAHALTLGAPGVPPAARYYQHEVGGAVKRLC